MNWILLTAWLIDYALLATVVLIAAVALRWCFRDPSQRVALAWGTWLGLLLLAVVIALPQWPRLAVVSRSAAVAEAPAEQRAAVRIDVPLELITEQPVARTAPQRPAGEAQALVAPNAGWEQLV